MSHKCFASLLQPWTENTKGKPHGCNHIEFNTEKRTKAKHDFAKDLFKLMNNSIFGKTTEDAIHKIRFDLTTEHVEDDIREQNLFNDPTYKRKIDINGNITRHINRL